MLTRSHPQPRLQIAFLEDDQLQQRLLEASEESKQAAAESDFYAAAAADGVMYRWAGAWALCPLPVSLWSGERPEGLVATRPSQQLHLL